MNLQTELTNTQNEIAKQKNWRTVDSPLFVASDLAALETQEADILKRMMDADNQTKEENLIAHVQAFGYTLDTIMIADVPVSECGLDEPTYNILKEKVEAIIVGQATTFSKQIDDLIEGNERET